MNVTEERRDHLSCAQCDTGVECCAFCDREDCPETICYRCLRIALGQMLAEPHSHGG